MNLSADEPGTRSGARWSPDSYLLLSLLLPGAGQVAQRRFGIAAIQVLTVGSYLFAAMNAGGGRAYLLALAWNAWSAFDAYRHATGSKD
jgi:hypothetical protein